MSLMEECGPVCSDYICPLCGAEFMLAIKEGPKIDDPTTGCTISKVGCPFCHHEIGHIMPWGKIPTESDVMGEL